MVKKPAAFFVEYADPVRFADPAYEPSYDDCAQKNAPNLPLARALAQKISEKYNTHVGIYERRGMEQIEPPYGPWFYDAEWVEDVN